MASLEHQNIVKTHGTSRNYRHFILVQEYLSGGTLQDTSFVVRKPFTKLPEDIQALIANMISTIPENRDSDGLQKAVELFRQHIQNRHHKTFTNEAAHGKRRGKDKNNGELQSANEPFAAAAKRNSSVATRMGFLFGLLLLIFVQYLYLFDGQEKINQSVPEVYSMLVGQFEGLRKD